MVFLLLAEKFSLGKLLSNGTAIMSSRNLLPIYCIPYSRCRYDFLCEYRYALSSYLMIQIITMHIAHIEIFCTLLIVYWILTITTQD